MSTLINTISKIENVARGPKINRLFNSPFKYVTGIIFTKIIFPFTRKGIKKQCNTFFNQPIDIMLPAGLDIYLLGAKSHDSEIRLAKYLINALRPGDTFLDIGAHFGYYTLLASHLVEESGRVFSIEASKEAFKVLKNNTDKKENTKIYNWAAARTDGNISFYEFPVLYSEYNSIDIEQYAKESWVKKNKARKNNVTSKSLMTIFNELSINPNFIKIDVEGAELDIVLGGAEVLNSQSPIIAMEFLLKESNKNKYEEAFDTFVKLGYQSHIIDIDGNIQPLGIQEFYIHCKNNRIDSDNLIFKKKAT